MNRKNSGQSIFEVLIALGIFSISIAASFQIFFGGQKLTIDSQNYNLATDYGRQGVEALRNIRARNFSELTDGAHGLVFQNNQWMFGSSSTSDTSDIFTRAVTVGTVDANTKIATTTVTWTSGAITQKVEIAEQLTHWETAGSPQSTCSSDPLSGNWASPRLIGTGSLAPENTGTDIAVRYPHAYVSSVSSSAGKPDLTIFNVTNPAAPTVTGSVDIGTGGINQIILKGNYIYGASTLDTKELVIIDVTNSAAPVLAGSLDLTGTSDALSVTVFNNTAAIGRLDTAANQLAFINVTNPAAPALISEANTGGDVHRFAVIGNTLYIAEEKDTADIRMYDISNPASPVFLATYDTSGVKENWSIYGHVKNGVTNLLVGNDASQFEEMGATTTNLYVRSKYDISGKIYDIACSTGDLSFLATDNSTKGLAIINVANPDSVTLYGSLDLSQNGVGVEYASNTIYMATQSNSSLKIIQP